MRENVFFGECGDIRLSVVLFEDAFRISGSDEKAKGIIEQWKNIHEHSTYEIFFVTDGCLSVVTEKETVEGREAMMIVPPRFSHYAMIPKEVSGYCMYFTMERLQKRDDLLFDVVQAELAKGISVLPMGEDSRFYAARVERSFEEGGAGRERLSHLIPLLFEEIVRQLVPERTRGDSVTDKYRRYVSTMDAYLAEHYCEDIHLSDLASELYLCPKQVSRIVRKAYGCSLSELVNRRRIAAACMLLCYTETEIGEIAARVGYEYENYFYKTFRQHHGMTPMQYRQRARAEASEN